jgi:hypothetical protein
LSGVNFAASEGNLDLFGKSSKELFPGNSVLDSHQATPDPNIIASLPGSFFSFGVEFSALVDSSVGPVATEITFTLSTGDTFTQASTSDLTFVGLLSTGPTTSGTLSIPPSPEARGDADLYVDNVTFGDKLCAVREPSSWILVVIGAGTTFGLTW